jgi:ACS family D-galactonate transporter-like MFS transporter
MPLPNPADMTCPPYHQYPMTPQNPGAPASRARYVILVLLLLGTMINYLDRTVMSIAMPTIQKELGLTATQRGTILSAFAWTYAAAQVPGGWVLDRIGVKLTYWLSVTLWSVSTMLQGIATGFSSLLGFRLALGAAEAPCFPANSRVLSAWFPQAERARATSIFSVGMYAGIGFLNFPLTWIANTWGWKSLFVLVGAIGVVFGILWLRIYREPLESPHANQAELDHIKAGGGLGHPAKPIPFRWGNLAFLLGQRRIVGAAIAQFAGNCTLSFFLTWFIPYLADARQMGWIRVGIFASLPFIAAAVGCLSGGWLSDLVLRRTGSATFARKLPIVCGFAMATLIMAVNYVQTDALVIAVMCVAFFGQGWINLGWTVITDVAPKKLFGLTTGLFNFVTNLAGIVTPLLIGYVRDQTGSYYWGLAFIAAMAVCGALSYLFVVGEVKRVEFEEPA